MARTAALPALKAESGLSHYLDEIRRFPMLEPQEEYMLARSWREHGDRDAAHKLVTSHLRLVAKIAMGYRGYGLPISEVDLGRQCRPDAGGQALRARKGLPPRHLRDVVDQGGDPGIHPALVVAREDGHHRQPEEAVLQPAQGEEQDFRARGRRPAARPGAGHRQASWRDRTGRGRHEPPPRRRRLAQRADPRRRRERRMAGLACRRRAQPGTNPGRERGERQSPQGADLGARRAQRSRTPHLRGAAARRRSDHARGARGRVRRLARARAPDRSARVRESAEGGEEPHRGARTAGRSGARSPRTERVSASN